MFEKIKVVVIDIDGCLTDGIYQISSTILPFSGESTVTKSFYTKDFYAIEELLKSEIIVIIMSQSSGVCIGNQIERLRKGRSGFWNKSWEENKLKLFLKIDNKKSKIEEFMNNSEKIISWENIAYMGDAENDLECIKEAGFAGCPFDAIRKVRVQSDYLANFPGGKGCVYDFCMYILEKRKEKK